MRTARPDRAAEVAIERLGALGDGIAETELGPMYVPDALPGERMVVRMGKPRGSGISARTVERLQTSDARVEPDCRHFGRCGGCVAQHMAEGLYRDWKLNALYDTFKRYGLPEDAIGDLHVCTPARRRVRFAAVGRRETAVVGFNARASGQILDLAACSIADPAIVALLEPLRELCGKLLKPKQHCDIEVLAADNGLDVMMAGRIRLNARARSELTEFAGSHGILRLSIQQDPREEPEEVVRFDWPGVSFGETACHPPPGAFLQPSTAGEAALREAVQLMIPPNTLRIAELYAGCGTFSLPLAAAGYRVSAYEGGEAMVRSMTQAAGRASLGGRLSGSVRDLTRQPLMPAELSNIDLVLLDPPRNGAGPQAELLAEAAVPAIVYVSCNPASFARDAAVLSQNGFTLVRALPIDQFVYSPHLELVSLLLRDA